MSTAEEISKTAGSLIDEAGGWTAFLRDNILGGIVFQIYAQLVVGIDSVGMIITGPISALGRGMILLVESTIGGVVGVFDAGTQTTIYSFTDGLAANLGILAQPFSVGVGMLTIAVFIWSLNRLKISPLSVLSNLNPRG